jgi:hypothetical protein
MFDRSTLLKRSVGRHLRPSIPGIVMITLLPSLWSQSQWSGSSPGPIYYTGGNVGIGTMFPIAPLHVAISPAGNASIATFLSTTPNTQSFLFVGNSLSIGRAGAVGFTDNSDTVSGYAWLAVYGDSPATGTGLMVQKGGNVGIGTTSPQHKLSVNGTIGAKEIVVTNAGWADYVLKPGYPIRPLSEVEAHIKLHRHLPDLPSEEQVQKKGVNLAHMQVRLLAKIEELTLHVIELDKSNRLLQQQNRETAKTLKQLEARLTR